MYLLDTCVCIEFLQGKLALGYQTMREGKQGDYAIPALVAAELMLGPEKVPDEYRGRQQMKVLSFVESLTVIPFDLACAKEYATLRAYLEAGGCRIGPNDMIVAATALAHKAVLVSGNMREFRRVPGIKLETWADVPWPGAAAPEGEEES